MTTNFREIWTKLRGKTFRKSFVESEVKRSIPFQMRAMLRQRGWSQEELAERSGLSQGAVSRALSPNYGNLSLSTIVRFAAGFDVAFVGRFVPFSALLDNHDDMLAVSAGEVEDFEQEDNSADVILAFLEKKSARREDAVTIATSSSASPPDRRDPAIRDASRRAGLTC